MLTKWRIEPNYIAVALARGVGGIARFRVRIKFEGMVISGIFEYIITTTATTTTTITTTTILKILLTMN